MTPDDLDQRLRAALHADPSAAQLARLEQFWHARSRAERRRQRRMRVVAVAAALLAIGTAWYTFVEDGPPAERNRNSVAQTALPRNSAPMANAAPEALPPSSREPTPYERLVFAARIGSPIDPEQALIAQLARATSVEQKQTLIRRLAERGSPRCVPALLEAAAQPAVQSQAIAAVEQFLGANRLADAVEEARSPAVRTALLARLLGVHSPSALDGFLALVSNGATRGEALAAADLSAAATTSTDTAAQFPLDALVCKLDSRNKSERLTAALVLGHVNGPAVSTALIARVSQTQHAPVEAWVALLACRGMAVDEFLAQAARRPQMLGQVNNARAYWARMMP